VVLLLILLLLLLTLLLLLILLLILLLLLLTLLLLLILLLLLLQPFKSLAAAKAKYGAGLHNGQYEDPNVKYVATYMAHNRRGVAACECSRG
jgi:hypothetical protein